MKREVATGKFDAVLREVEEDIKASAGSKTKFSLGSTAEIFWPHGNRRSDLKRKKDGGLKRRAEGILF